MQFVICVSVEKHKHVVGRTIIPKTCFFSEYIDKLHVSPMGVELHYIAEQTACSSLYQEIIHLILQDLWTLLLRLNDENLFQ